ncbi:hypothetical protein LAZ67_11001247 [Cordylochernes scorpioides]|uniref:Uncharacterized protein n=1 Tax=Cordylochernes scorpioides TaxID=51811 RepID=A0ABY6KZ21_9ARAC|nr:hypothetical protein LAZ67_11001247 [Cordylochernes scorpioides]
MNISIQNKLNTIECNTLENASKILVNAKIEDADTIMEVDTGADVTLSSAEAKYSQTEKEALAIVFATSKLRQYLFRRKFVFESIHNALTTVFGDKRLLPPLIANRMHDCALELSNFDFDIKKTNKDNMLCADAFSRLPFEAVIPRTCQDQMLKLLHQGHIGVDRMKSLARSSIWWPKMDSQIEEFVKECSPFMHYQAAPPAENTPWPRTNQPCQRVHNTNMLKILIGPWTTLEQDLTDWNKTLKFPRHLRLGDLPDLDILLASDDTNFEAGASSEPQLLTQGDVNDLVRDLDLSKKQSELSGSRLKGWNLLHKGTKNIDPRFSKSWQCSKCQPNRVPSIFQNFEDSRDRERHYIKKSSWPNRETFTTGHKNIVNPPLIDSENIYSPPLHIKLELMKNFVKAMDRNASGFAYLKQKYSSISDAKIKEGIFVGPQIRELLQDGNFQNSLNEVELAAWNSFRNVCKNFLGSVKVENYRDVVIICCFPTRHTGM